MRKVTGVGVIGLGKMGLLHASIFSVIPDVRLTAVCESNGRILRFARKLFPGVPVVDRLDGLSGLALDALCVTTPIPSHYPIMEAVYSNGLTRNVFVEKTLASSYAEAMKLCRLAEERGGVHMVGYMSRFAATFRKAKELLAQKTIGEILSFEAYAYASDFAGEQKNSVRKGGALRDLGAHVVDLGLWFFGDLDVETARIESFHHGGAEDGGNFKVTSADGLKGEFDISWSREGYRSPEFGLRIKGTSGTMRVDNDSVKLESNAGTSKTWHRQSLSDSAPFLLAAPEYYREDEHFVKAILEEHVAESNFLTASKVDELIDQVIGKARQNDK